MLSGSTAVALLLSQTALSPQASPETWQSVTRSLEGYVSARSVRPGQTFDLHVSSTAEDVTVDLLPLGSDVPIQQHVVPGGLQAVPQLADAEGCGWSSTARLELPEDIDSGIFLLQLRDDERPAAEPFEIPLVVRAAESGPRAPLLVLTPDITVQAYNEWGGRSLYVGADGRRSQRASFERPHQPGEKGSLFRQWPRGLPAWLEAEGLAADYASEVDLQTVPDLLDPYECVLLAGHHEYWTAAMRAALDAYVGEGGRVLVLSGNTMSWQVRLEREARQVVSYKNPLRDPAFRSSDPVRRRTTSSLFLFPPVDDPEERSLGLSFLHAAYVTIDKQLDPSILSLRGVLPRFAWDAGFGGYRVAAPDHPSLVGWPAPVLGAPPRNEAGATHAPGLAVLELDGAVLEADEGGALHASHVFGAPRSLQVLAFAPAGRGFAAIAAFEDGGEVLNAGTQGFRSVFRANDPEPLGAAEFVRNNLVRMTRPRRSRLRWGGFERWEAGRPLGLSARSSGLEQAPRPASGRAAVRLRKDVPARVAIVLGEVPAGDYVLCFWAQAEADEASALAVRVEAQDGALLLDETASVRGGAARVLGVRVPEAPGPLRLEFERTGGGAVDLDQVEFGPREGFDAEALAPRDVRRQADPEEVALDFPALAGGLHVQLLCPSAGAEHSFDVVLQDRLGGEDLASFSLRTGAGAAEGRALWGGQRTLALPHPGRMLHPTLLLRSRGGALPDPAGWRLLPLRIPVAAPESRTDSLFSRLVADRITNGRFELQPALLDPGGRGPDWSDSPPGWLLSHPKVAVLTTERAFEGEGSLRLTPEVGDEAWARMQLVGSFPIGVPVRVQVRAWCAPGATATLEVATYDPQPPPGGERVVARATPTTHGQGRWELLEVELSPLVRPPDQLALFPLVGLRVEGGPAWFDALVFEP